MSERTPEELAADEMRRHFVPPNSLDAETSWRCRCGFEGHGSNAFTLHRAAGIVAALRKAGVLTPTDEYERVDGWVLHRFNEDFYCAPLTKHLKCQDCEPLFVRRGEVR